MKVIGITGGVGSGKSTVLHLLEERLESHIIMADDVAKETMLPGRRGYLKVIEMFGDEILDTKSEAVDGYLPIDRKKLAEIVFAQPNKRMVINSIIHPLVKQLIIEEITKCKISGQYDYVFVEAALLIEDRYDTICDELWYIYVPDEIRRMRLKSSREYSDEKITHIFESQLAKEEYEKACIHVVDNSEGIENTWNQLVKFL